ncbi:MAG: RNA-binding S4 domain-containing protein [Gemmatimonadaceae bacterium]
MHAYVELPLTVTNDRHQTPPVDIEPRLDKWLWAARFYRTRALAAEAIALGRVQLNGERVKRAARVKAGDSITIRSGPFERHIAVTGLSPRRGPAAEAARLYEETAASREARQRVADQLRLMSQGTGHERGRPSKKDRRDIARLRGRRAR